MNYSDNLKKGEKGAWLSIITYIILSAVKIVVAYIGDSDALRADGLNNSTDVVASVAVLIGLKISRKPPDEDHHYGHYRAESVASLFAAFIMAVVGIEVIIDTLQTIFSGTVPQPNMITAWTALGSALVMFFVYRYNLKLSKRIESASLYAASQDNRSDALVSLGAFVGIAGAQLGLLWLDPLAGFIVGIIICKTAWEIFKDATHTLTDGFDEDQLIQIKESIREVDDVLHVLDVKGRIHGNGLLIEATILVDPSLTVDEGHQIADKVEKQLEGNFRISHAHIHIEPFFPKENQHKKQEND